MKERAVKRYIAIACLVALWPALCLAEPPFSSSQYWPPSARPHQVEFETILNAVPTRLSLRAFHEQMAAEPHIAGTPGDARTIQRLITAFRMLGLDVHVHEFWAYLTLPIEARVDIVSPDPMSLAVKEQALPEDRFSRHQALTIGFNAYSADGDVTGEIVYANYGTKDDFARLRELGVDCTGKIVLARYGGNFRGYKAKFAQEAGAAALIIYTDPDDSGYRKGVPYPEGGWANESYIQRGSLNTLEYPGDPLTPFKPAVENAERLNPQEIALPRIPVQPIGYGAAREIMLRMKGRPLPPDLVKSWQGGLPCAYRLEGGPDLRVRVMVKQQRQITKTANVVGTLWGSAHPEQKIIIGCHHDAWCHGAGDPLAGLILLLESARSFFDATQKGYMPARSIVFAAWGAEEYGIVGSTEYCEEFGQTLLSDSVAYINLDAAAMGTNFSASASPSLKQLIEEVTRDVPQARDASNRTIYPIWLGDRDEPHFGNLGGGSDHVGFYCHLGIPSCGLNAGGAQGTAYHSNYDNVQWYQQVVGDDYEPAIMLTRVLNLVSARLADSHRLPLDPVRYAPDTKAHLQTLAERAGHLKVEVNFDALINRIDEYELLSRSVMERLAGRLAEESLHSDALAAINLELVHLEREWLGPAEKDTPSPAGSRPWFRNLFAASDPDSGYSAWMLPRLRMAIESRDAGAVENAVGLHGSVFDRLEARIRAIEAAMGGAEASQATP